MGSPERERESSIAWGIDCVSHPHCTKNQDLYLSTQEPFDKSLSMKPLDTLTLLWILTPITLVATSFITAPYGRHFQAQWGPSLPPRLAWILFESPTLLLGLPVFLQGRHVRDVVPWLLLALHQGHYVHRVLVFPLRMRGRRQASVPLAVVILAFAFNVLNTIIQMRAISDTQAYPLSWICDVRFLGGLALFVTGMAINIHSDGILRQLRKGEDDQSYHIPRGSFFELVTSANYFGEMVEWGGWAVVTWSSGGLAFFAYTVANLGPRSLENHQWYLAKFEDYPQGRRALVPFLL